MLTQICQEIHNWFEREKLYGDFRVTDGVLTYADGSALSLLNGQYYRVIGSVFNDGVHRFGTETAIENNEPVTRLFETLTDEPEFSGAVWAMAVPPVVVELDAEIEQWIADNAKAIASPYQSESFGGYSYSLKSGDASDRSVGGATWQNQFAARLGPWRKI